MAKPKNTGLGRGLDAIFLDNSIDESGGVIMLRLSDIEPNPDQPRREFEPEALAQLADSIAAHGLIQPIIVRSAGADGYYQIVAGERRWRASKMAGLSEVPVIIMEMDDKKAAQIALIENIQRENLNPMEEAAAYKSLLKDYGMTQEELSKQIGKSRSAVANTLRLLELPEEICTLVRDGRLSAGHARALLGLKNPARMAGAASAAVGKNLSVRETEALVRKLNRLDAKIAAVTEGEDEELPTVDYTAVLAKKMTSRLGRRVEIKKTGTQKKLTIHFENDADLDELVTRLCGDNIFDE
ncbi:MAG: ParB/RepB/Spo0J family partition protein [Ruminococcaceae bacterium]|nr:ParB/RepB/Spo0J family partition protein [Oscillospiraceae bacterium]